MDEEKYTNPSIQALFSVIEKDKITPEERARMKEEYNREEVSRQAFQEADRGVREEKEKTARNLMGIAVLTEEQIASVTGLSLEMIKALGNSSH